MRRLGQVIGFSMILVIVATGCRTNQVSKKPVNDSSTLGTRGVGIAKSGGVAATGGSGGAASGAVGGSGGSPYSHTIVIDGNNDFTANDTFSTSTTCGYFYFFILTQHFKFHCYSS